MREADYEAAQEQVELLGKAEGFFHSCILFALLRLGVFRIIGRSEMSSEAIAAAVGASEEHLVRLLRAGVMLGLLETEDGRRFRVRAKLVPILVDGTKGSYLGNWLRFLDYLYPAFAGLDRVVTGERPILHLLQEKGAHDVREFVLAMHNYAALRGSELADYLDTNGCTTLLDLGCGPGTYSFSLGLANPGLELHLLDLPEVIQVAREIQKRYPVKNGIHYHEGSYDLVLVSNSLHMLGAEGSRELLARLYAAVNPGGSVVVQAQFLDENRLGRRWLILLDLIQLCITPCGRNHSAGETKGWMEAAGFQDIEICDMGLLNTNSFLRGYKLRGYKRPAPQAPSGRGRT